MDTSDDAGVYRLTDEIALIQTLDFLTPVVDDPFTFGQIAVCNGLSDVYAMGGRPLTAMNIVCFPTDKFSMDILGRILEGGQEVLTRAEVQILGGHSVDDVEMKYGVSVTGIVHPEKIIRNCGLRDGDALILTKPLGTGIISTAVKAGLAGQEIIAPYAASMTTLNDRAAEIMLGFGVHACTDITGFGLMGHLKEMISGEALELVLETRNIPLLPGARENAAMGLIPAGMYRNRDYVGSLYEENAGINQEIRDLLFDPQTSGGLLIALAETEADRLLEELHAAGIQQAARIGRIRASSRPLIRIT